MEEIVKLIKNGVVQYPITKPEAVIDETGLSLVQKLEEKANKTEIPTKVSQLENDAEYATKSEIDGKQDEIKDLDAIRSGAAKGATALQSIPAEYVTDDELDNALRPKVNVNQIATINGKSLVNGGNIVITGGEGGGYDDTEIRAELTQLSAEIGQYEAKITDITSSYKEEKTLFYQYASSNYKWIANDYYYWRLYEVAEGEILVLKKINNRSAVRMVVECEEGEFVAGGNQGNLVIDVDAPLGEYEYRNNGASTKYIAVLYKYYSSTYFEIYRKEFVSLTEKVKELEETAKPITTDRIVDGAVTMEKTSFVKVAQGKQLFDKNSMAVSKTYYWFNPQYSEAVGGYAEPLQNEYTNDYTAIKIPIEDITKVAISQTDGYVYNYFCVDVDMRILSFGTPKTSIGTYVIEIPQGCVYLLSSVRKYNAESFMVNEGDNPLPFEEYSLDTYVNGIKLTEHKEQTKEIIEICLPKKLYAVVGDTLQIFYRSIMKVVNPYNYDIVVQCSKGNAYPRYWEYTPKSSDVGEMDLSIIVRDNSRNTLATATCKVVTSMAISSTSQKNIACFGDSLTTNGDWCAEAARRLVEGGGEPIGDKLSNLSFVGKKTKNGYGFFGEGGWKWSSYTTKGETAYRFFVSNVGSLSINATYSLNDSTYRIIEVNVTNGDGNILCIRSGNTTPPTSGVLTKQSGSGDSSVTYTNAVLVDMNPLWDDSLGKMSFKKYADEYCNGVIDVVCTLLTWNGLTDGMTSFDSILEQVKVFADTLHADFPNAKLLIFGIQMPSYNGGMGANYGASGNGYADWYGMMHTAMNLNKAYQEFAEQDAYKSFVSYIDVASQFDSENNMPSAEISVNTRNKKTELRGTNGVHPSIEGYYQIADVAYRAILANL